MVAGSDEYISDRLQPELAMARERELPVQFLSALIDPLVPRPFVKHWLKCHCPGLRECKIISTAERNVVGMAPERSAE